MELAQQLMQLRKAKGWTQAYAASQIGIQQSYLSKLENGKFIPSDEVIAQISEAYQISKAQLSANHHTARRMPILAAALVLIALLSFLTAHFQLAFQQTYYTYEFNLSSPRFSDIEKGYQVTQTYFGEKFISQDDAIEYVLIGERNISRQENNWLYALSVVSLVLGFVMMLRVWRQVSVT